jgi:hypothetical protein
VKDEAAEGARRNILVPVLIGDVEIPLGFRQIHAVMLDASGDADAPAYDDLVASVEQVLRRSPDGSARLATADARRDREPSAADQHTPRHEDVRPATLGSGTVPKSYLYGALALALAFAAVAAWDRLKTPRAMQTNDSTAAPASEGSASSPATHPEPPGTGSSAVAASSEESTSSGLVVSGKGQHLYYVFDGAGTKQLGYSLTNAPIDLFPGDYVVVLNGVRRPVRVAHRRRLTLESGTVTVSGSGGTLFYVHDTTGKTQLGYALTKASIEIFPGDYRVTLNGVTVPATVRPGRDTAIAAGRLMAPGSGSTLYYVYNAAGTARLTYAMTNSEVELLPGEYQVELNSVRRVARVTAGQQSVVDR